MECPFCKADVGLGSVRCGSCGRSLPLNEFDINDLKKGKGAFANFDRLSDDDLEMLNSWMLAQKKLKYEHDHRFDLLVRGGMLVLNMFVAAMILLTVSLLGMYLALVFAPEYMEWLVKWVHPQVKIVSQIY